MLNILVLGGSGQLGAALSSLSWPPDVNLHMPSHSVLDSADPPAVTEFMAARPWSCVVNASGFTAVDAAESQVAAAWRGNAIGPTLLAAAAAKRGLPIIHVSTDYVFDGTKTEPYEPQDPVCPLNVYGESKAEGEQGVRSANPRHVIIRTSWLISPYGKNFAKTMLQRAVRGNSLRVVNDQTGCPTSATDLAAALRTISLRLSLDPHAPLGAYHFANAGRATWWELAREIMAGASHRGMPSVAVEPISTAEYPTAAVRPTNCVLSMTSLTRDYGIVPRPWRLALSEILDVMQGHAIGKQP
jgi:dTDP-4-dehydrorhamnose reductase